MPDVVEQPESAKPGLPGRSSGDAGAKPGRSLTGFYVAIGIVIALGLFGAWFWTAWNVWWFDAAEAKRRQNEAARQLSLPIEKSVELGDGIKIDLVLIPAGRFRMGDQSGQAKAEGYQWVQITKPFYIGKYEVTQEVWEKVMRTNPSEFKGAKNPVENVSWNDCQAFLKKLNERFPHPIPLPAGEGASRVPAPSGRGKGEGTFRLPTEAEWEWACRAGTKMAFCPGDSDADLGDYAWFNANSGGTTHPVGKKQPNAWGLHDMHGNTREWCGDWGYDYPPGWKPQVDPTGPAMSFLRVLRGGSWSSDPRACRSSDRGHDFPGQSNSNYGFRVALLPAVP